MSIFFISEVSLFDNTPKMYRAEGNTWREALATFGVRWDWALKRANTYAEFQELCFDADHVVGIYRLVSVTGIGPTLEGVSDNAR